MLKIKECRKGGNELMSLVYLSEKGERELLKDILIIIKTKAHSAKQSHLASSDSSLHNGNKLRY